MLSPESSRLPPSHTPPGPTPRSLVSSQCCLGQCAHIWKKTTWGGGDVYMLPLHYTPDCHIRGDTHPLPILSWSHSRYPTQQRPQCRTEGGPIFYLHSQDGFVDCRGASSGSLNKEPIILSGPLSIFFQPSKQNWLSEVQTTSSGDRGGQCKQQQGAHSPGRKPTSG